MQSLVGFNVDNHIQLVEPTTVVCGDANSDTQLNAADAVFIITYIFKGDRRRFRPAGPTPIMMARSTSQMRSI